MCYRHGGSGEDGLFVLREGDGDTALADFVAFVFVDFNDDGSGIPGYPDPVVIALDTIVFDVAIDDNRLLATTGTECQRCGI